MGIKKCLKNNKIMSYAIIFFMTLAICIPLFSNNMNISYDDGIQHICRLIGTYNSIKDNALFPTIMSEFCNGFGYSWNIFYSPLTAYLPLVFKIFTSSFVMCLKLFMFFTMFLSGLFMYKLVYKMSKSHKAGVFSAIIFMMAPYHLTDLYSRVAIAELASFVFLPLVFLGLYSIINNENNAFYTLIGAIGLILSHNVITVYTAIFSFIYLLINYKKITLEMLRKILICVVLIVLCTSFYWLPLLEHYCSTIYEVFVPQRMYSNETIIGSKLGLLDLFIETPWGMNFHIGLPILLGIILFIIYNKRIRKLSCGKDTLVFLIFGLISIIMATKIFPFEYLPDLFKMLQFTWRMEEFSCFFLSIVAGIAIQTFIGNSNNKLLIINVFIIISWLILMLNTDCYTKNIFNEEKYLQPIPVNGNTGRVHAGCATFEYLPQKAYLNLNYIKTRSKNVILMQGTAIIENENKNGTKMTFEVKNVGNNTIIELPYIYYLGYNAKVIDENNNIVNLQIEESKNGFCMINTSNIDNGKVEIKYTGTTLMKISYVLTIIGIVAIIYFKIYKM